MIENLTEDRIAVVLRAFYARIRRDPSLARPFAVVEDWEEHITRLTDFWSSLMLTSGRYKGNPVAMHLVHTDKIEPEMFARWLELWKETTDELVSPVTALQMQAKAGRVATRLSQAMFGQPPQASPLPAAQSTAAAPYKITPTFDERSVPTALLRSHSRKEGSWGLIRVEEGAIRYLLGDQSTVLAPNRPGVIPPLAPHHLEIDGPVKFRIEFYDGPLVQPLQ
ncbi:truncated hemoglobin YjbI/tellurite resistance-related uncharacterized protein [Rhizobium sp. BK650]|uniref:DUF1971 domain-containing protein n=1 Tax=Rhizobium sp. BK650 TaxID=2586990 RepID=UPI00160F1D32|nr:DUF1971 domain-containing protein [Rhizobium sp. BK650]MBB3659418.1 truncated hemoglobin YjbI/tellurite resistance-related uncharacterized protein [Rhizobium sp. BK650]